MRRAGAIGCATVLTGRLLQPQILAALARAGHGSRILVADGNYPHWTTRGPNAEVTFLNLNPGVVSATNVVAALLAAVRVESVAVMAPPAGDPEPPIWEEFRTLLGLDEPLEEIERFAFYEAAASPDVTLTVASADERLYANLLLTIGVAA